jgi:hypothetical protein
MKKVIFNSDAEKIILNIRVQWNCNFHYKSITGWQIYIAQDFGTHKNGYNNLELLYFLEYPAHIFQKKFVPKKWDAQSIHIKVNSATYLSYLALWHIPEGSSPLLC